jgi:phosphopantetheinyl transferase
MKAPIRGPVAELHVWRARLGSGVWPDTGALPAVERDRAAKLLSDKARKRWVASRWALRSVLGRYLELEPAEVELRCGERGKPMLAEPAIPLRFNLSHSGELALIAVAGEREVGVDVQRLGARPAGFYADWARREAIAKCHGVGLGAQLPDAPVAAAALDAGAGFAAAIAVSGDEVPPLRHLVADEVPPLRHLVAKPG